jgi:hypothetical protein
MCYSAKVSLMKMVNTCLTSQALALRGSVATLSAPKDFFFFGFFAA